MSKTTIPTGGITDATIATGDIADNAVTVAKTSGVGFGVQNVDQFRLTSNFNGDAGAITSNLSRVSEVGAAGGAVGSQMAFSSGVFTFPQTGMYLVEFRSAASWTGTILFHTTAIQVTVNNSDYTTRAEGDMVVTDPSGTWYGSTGTSFLVDVTNVSNVKVRFKIDAANNNVTTRGSTNVNLTYMTFTRLGDT